MTACYNCEKRVIGCYPCEERQKELAEEQKKKDFLKGYKQMQAYECDKHRRIENHMKSNER